MEQINTSWLFYLLPLLIGVFLFRRFAGLWRRPASYLASHKVTNLYKDQFAQLCDLFKPEDWEKFQDACQSLVPLTSISKHVQTELPEDSVVVTLLQQDYVRQAVQNIVGEELSWVVDSAKFQFYPVGSQVPWHQGQVLHEPPQYDCVLTLENSSDSQTRIKNSQGQMYVMSNLPNSLLITRAGGPWHSVSPVNRGSRSVIQFSLMVALAAEQTVALDSDVGVAQPGSQSSRISILLPVRNGGPYLETAVRSIIQQTYPHWELLLIDDGSTDGMPQRIATWGDPRIRVLQDGLHKGLAMRLNEGVQAATGEYIARMDADDVAFPERLMKQVQYLDAHPGVDLLGTRAVAFRGEGEPIGLLPFSAQHAMLTAYPWRNIPLPHPTWMGRRSWFAQHLYRWPEVMRAEDQELLLRAYPESQYACLPDVLLGYRQGPFQLKRTLLARGSLLRAQLGLFIRRRQWGCAVAAVLLTFIKVLIDILAALPKAQFLFFRRMSAPINEGTLEILKRSLSSSSKAV